MNYIIPDKFSEDRETSVFLAKKYLKESVYRSAHLEGIAVTFPETEAILDNRAVNGIAPRDISKVCDLRDAWKYILENLDAPLDLKFLEDLHSLIAREDVPWEKLGKLRIESVRISGTNHIPETPSVEKIHAELKKLQENPNETDRSISIGLFIMRSQLFLDGNKRVGTLAANKLLVETGRGIFSIPDDKSVDFSAKLVKFYETDNSDDLKKFISDFCLTGLTRE